MVRRLALLLIVVVTLIAGCGGGGGGGSTSGAVSAATTGTAGTTTAVDDALRQHVQSLIVLARQPQAGKPRQEQLKIANAQAELLTIASENKAAIQPLLTALEKPDYDLILDLHNFYIQLGKPRSEKAIGDALQSLQPSPTNNPVVFDYLGSGNGKLIAAARRWASSHGYQISGTPTPIAGGWSSSGVYGPPYQPPVAPPPSKP
jgi:hypothetical protein